MYGVSAYRRNRAARLSRRAALLRNDNLYINRSGKTADSVKQNNGRSHSVSAIHGEYELLWLSYRVDRSKARLDYKPYNLLVIIDQSEFRQCYDRTA